MTANQSTIRPGYQPICDAILAISGQLDQNHSSEKANHVNVNPQATPR